MYDYDGNTWVAFSDLCGLKAMYRKDPREAASALDRFYNITFDLQREEDDINSLVVSDCAIFWIDQEEPIYDSTALLDKLKSLHIKMLPDYLIKTSIAYGHFKYQRRSETPSIRKNMIVGGGYLVAYAENDNIEAGSITVVQLPPVDSEYYVDVFSSASIPFKDNFPHDGFREYFWSLNHDNDIDSFIRNRNNIKESVYAQYKSLYNNMSI